MGGRMAALTLGGCSVAKLGLTEVQRVRVQPNGHHCVVAAVPNGQLPPADADSNAAVLLLVAATISEEQNLAMTTRLDACHSQVKALACHCMQYRQDMIQP